MKRFLALVLAMPMIMLIVSCDQQSAPIELKAEIGTKALFRQGSQELSMEITALDGALVRTEITSNDQIVSLRDYYRGLIPVAGTDGGRNFSFDFDTDDLDPLFPLAVGNSVSVSGTLTVEGFDQPLEVVVQASVKAKKAVTLKRERFEVLVVEIEQIYRGPNGVRTRTDTYHHAPDLALNLKSVTRDDNFQSYWYVTDVSRPGATLVPSNPGRPGSVMI